MAPLVADPTMSSSNNSSRPTIDDLTGDNHFAQLARKHWLAKSKAPKVQQKVVNEDIWNHVEQEGFAYGSLLLLEQLQLLEKYLWPGYSDDASNSHVLLLALLVNVKRREGLPVWGMSFLLYRIHDSVSVSHFRSCIYSRSQTCALVPLPELWTH